MYSCALALKTVLKKFGGIAPSIPADSITLFSDMKNGICPALMALSMFTSMMIWLLLLMPLMTPFLPGIPIAISIRVYKK